jgi:hypothetical protein
MGVSDETGETSRMGTYGTGTEHAESASRSAERSTEVNMMAADDD